jgi:hypothetical protein
MSARPFRLRAQNPSRRRPLWSAATALPLLLAAWLSLAGCASHQKTSVECRLKPRTRESVSRFVLSSPVHYLQRDRRWSAEPIGGSGKPLGAVGCTVCCLSMALTQHGIERTPYELNRQLKAADGYSSKGWVRWAAIGQVTGGKLRAEVVHRPTHRDIEQALAAGNPVLVKVAPPAMIQHWVLLVGRDGRDFLMKDPLDATRIAMPLSSLCSDILAVRVVKRNAL